MFGKIFGSVFTGSMYGSGPTVFAVWAYVIATARPPGTCELNPRLLADCIGCSVDDVRKAIEYLCAPDPNSRNPEHEGRRLLHIEAYTYQVVSWQKYRDMRDDESRRAYQREWIARKRRERKDASANADNVSTRSVDKMSTNVRQTSTVDTCLSMSTKAEAEEEEEEKKKQGTQKVSTVSTVSTSTRKPRNCSTVSAFALPDWVPRDDWDAFVAMRQSLRKPMTDRAKQLVVLELDRLRKAGHPPGLVLQQSIRRSWQDVYALREPATQQVQQQSAASKWTGSGV